MADQHMRDGNGLEPAFGFHSPDCGTSRGLRKREYFAVQALNALLGNELFMKNTAGGRYCREHQSIEEAADVAVIAADALLARLGAK